MGLMKTLALSSKELKSILDRLTALESGDTFVTKQMFDSLSQSVTIINKDVKDIIKGKNYDALLSIYPVGSIYLSVDSENPSTKFGGTWIPWGKGRVPVGVNETDSDFNAVEKTGGEKAHKLTISEMPDHVHSVDALSLKKSGESSAQSGSGTFAFSGLVNTTSTDGMGDGNSHNNLQPYITCYMWKRTA